MIKGQERILITRGCALIRARLAIGNSEIKRLRQAENDVHAAVLASSINGLSLADAERGMFDVIETEYGIKG